uniref:carbamoyltransferase family protein n=1 Tax=Ningiella ruwaisensis TaxID=2364274 RepID=UPI00109FB977|nr:carbamoyltransferase [Ningiella ruwaisensis]
MSAILGISAFYHDSAAAIIVNGKIVAAAQQERYSRLKHYPRFPKDAIQYCLKEAQIDLEALDAIVFYDKPLLKFERLLETFLAHAPRGFLAFSRAMPIWLKEKLYLKSLIRREMREIASIQKAKIDGIELAQARKIIKKTKLRIAPLYFTEHHQSHAAAAFYPSPYQKAAIVCLDGVGEWASSSIWLGDGNQITPLEEIQFPHSLGLLYSAFTYYCGFKVNSGEYKLMGLAPYGHPVYVDTIKKHIVEIFEDGSFALNMEYFAYPVGKRMINRKFEKLFGAKAHPFDAEITQQQMDIARSIQVVTEEIVLNIAKRAKLLTGCEHLCMAGGVALNCVANGKLRLSGLFKDIWIQPAAGDAGSAVGAVLQVYHQALKGPRQAYKGAKQTESLASAEQHDFKNDAMCGAYLGDAFSDEEILQACSEQALVTESLDDETLFNTVAELLTQEMVVGWFQGRMEFGPRALGNRSILGDPRSPSMQSQMNLKIKQRESFRPFAPAVLTEDVTLWFDMHSASPYMLMVASLKQEHCLPPESPTKGHRANTGSELKRVNEIRSSVPAITHVDYSARVQSVHKQTNPRFYALIEAFKAKTGIGMLINTSFNVRGEPPVRNPNDAIRCFLACDMDILVMGNILLRKKDQPLDAIRRAKLVSFEKD